MEDFVLGCATSKIHYILVRDTWYYEVKRVALLTDGVVRFELSGLLSAPLMYHVRLDAILAVKVGSP
jgi:hypothetical protein